MPLRKKIRKNRLPTLYGRSGVPCGYREELMKWRREVWGGVAPRYLTKAWAGRTLSGTPPGGSAIDTK